MEPSSTNFGARLKALIENRGVTQVQFAKDCGLSEATLYNWLKKKAPPHEKYWFKLATYLGVSESYLAYGTPLKTESIITEAQAPCGTETMMEKQVQEHINSLLGQARGDPARLGWLLEQLRAHVRAPEHWDENIHDELLQRALRVEAEAKRRKTQPSPGKAQGGAGR